MSQSLIRVVHIVVTYSSVAGHPVVPEGHSLIVPLDTDLQVSSHRDVLLNGENQCLVSKLTEKGSTHVEQQLEKGIGLLIFQPYDAAREAWVDVERFFAG